ncbi:hypothetical protein [Chryseobacterium wanjuense]
MKNDPDFAQEKGYFLLCKGISDYKKKQYKLTLDHLNPSIALVKKSGDFAWLSVGYFYVGKSYLGLKNNVKSIIYFKKVDSIFQKHQFILPELRENYELLINHYKKEKIRNNNYIIQVSF